MYVIRKLDGSSRSETYRDEYCASKEPIPRFLEVVDIVLIEKDGPLIPIGSHLSVSKLILNAEGGQKSQ